MSLSDAKKYGYKDTLDENNEKENILGKSSNKIMVLPKFNDPFVRCLRQVFHNKKNILSNNSKNESDDVYCIVLQALISTIFSALEFSKGLANCQPVS